MDQGQHAGDDRSKHQESRIVEGDMKYRLRYLNCVQETDSEDRKKELEAKGYKLEENKSLKKPASKGVQKE